LSQIRDVCKNTAQQFAATLKPHECWWKKNSHITHWKKTSCKWKHYAGHMWSKMSNYCMISVWKHTQQLLLQHMLLNSCNFDRSADGTTSEYIICSLYVWHLTKKLSCRLLATMSASDANAIGLGDFFSLLIKNSMEQ